MESRRDLSSEYLLHNVDLQRTEKPIPYKEFLYHSKARDKEIEYRILKKITETKQHMEFLSNLPENHLQNRYHDILPYRDTMVNMSSGQYINANEISFSSTEVPRIIATQGPMSNTCAAFWKMVWEHDVSLIIMCCSFIENDMPKCFEYFSSANSLAFDEFEVLVLKEVPTFDFAIKRSILLTNSATGNSKKITHFHLNSWEDNSVPSIKEYFGALNYAIFLIQHKLQKHLGKVLIHCSAGIGRTGVVICIYELVTSLQSQLESTEVPSVSVFGTVRKLREQRWGMVATEAQYEFIYRFMDYWIAAYIYSNEN